MRKKVTILSEFEPKPESIKKKALITTRCLKTKNNQKIIIFHQTINRS